MSLKPTYDQLVERLRELEKERADTLHMVTPQPKEEQAYRDVFENAEILSAVYAKDGTCLMINRKLAGLLGGRPQQFIGISVDKLLPGSATEYKKHIAQVFMNSEVRRFEERTRFADCSLWLLSIAQPLTDAGGHIEACLITSIDITDRKHKEEQAIQFKTAVEHSSDAIGMSTPEGVHWYQNKAFDRLFGDIGLDPPSKLYADEKIGRHIFKTIMAGKQWTGEVEMFDAAGNILNILLRAYAIKDSDGRVVGLVGTHTDISARIVAESALREREERMQALLMANPDPLVMYDNEGNPQYINPAFTEVFGWSLDELRGRRIPFVPEDQKEITAKQIKDIYTSKTTARFETRRLTKDGRILDIIVSAAIIKGPDGNPAGMTVNLTDITQRKSLQAQYEQALRMEALGTLAGGVAHDFNNLLMGIQGRASLMAVNLQPSHPFYEHVHGIEEYVKSAGDLTRQLLGFARGGKYEVKPIDFNDSVLSCAEMFGRTRKEITIHTNLDDRLPPVEADQRQIEQVLLNIFVNAWQAMPDGGNIFIETRQTSLDSAFCMSHQIVPGTYVSVSITDTGIGMEESVRRRIFDPFFTTKEKSRGTGLGLASAFGIIRNHGGIITVESRKGHGATFSIYLRASTKTVTRDAPAGKSLKTGKEMILLVDDETLILEVGRAMLEMLGYTVVCVGSGKEAVNLLSRSTRPVDLVILDLIMPGMDGVKTFEQLRRINPHLRVLLSSGYARDGQAEEVMKKGCNGFIQKPFTIQDLSTKIRSILDAPESQE